VEGALSNCRLRKLRINVHWGRDPPQQTSLFCAFLRGIAANHNDVEFVLLQEDLDGEDLMSQLPHQYSERFELVKRGAWTYFILKPRTRTGNQRSSPLPSSPERPVITKETTMKPHKPFTRKTCHHQGNQNEAPQTTCPIGNTVISIY
jgi:hypothetical protein